MFETIINAFKVKEIRSKIVYTLLILLVVRFGSYIPVPGINPDALNQIFSEGNGLLNIIDSLAGGSLSRFTVFAMGIIPYINASIIMTLLTAGFDSLKAVARDDSKKIAQWTRYLALGIGFIQAIGLTIFITANQGFANPNMFIWVISTLTLTAGTMVLMWLGESINEHGIGNGISLIIFIGIVSRMPGVVTSVIDKVKVGETPLYLALLLVVVVLITIVGIVAVTQGERKIPVHYAKRVVGRKMYGGQSTFIPIKINQAGVIPIIFASSLLVLPGTIISIFFSNTPAAAFFTKWFGVNTVAYILIYALLIIAFTFFYSVISFNPVDVADNLKKNGGFIPGIRPGRPTAEALQRVLTRITLFGAVFLAIIALLPNVLGGMIGGSQLQFGGTSLLIAVGVALDTMKQIESQLLMRHYKGFLK